MHRARLLAFVHKSTVKRQFSSLSRVQVKRRPQLARCTRSFHLAFPSLQNARSEAAKGGADSEGSPDEDDIRATREREEFEDKTSDLRTRVLEAALLHVPEQGWTEEALARGADDLGLSIAAAGMFPNGAAELVKHFVESQNKRLADELPEIIASAKAKAAESASDTSEFDGLGTTDLLKIGIRTRLEYNVPHVRTWSQAMALGATTPQNVANTAEAVGAIADEIWHCAGDMSADTSWYTKRAVGKLSA